MVFRFSKSTVTDTEYRLEGTITRSDLSILRPPGRLQTVWSTAAGEQAAYAGHLRGVLDDQLDVHLFGYGLVPSALRAGVSVSIQVPVDKGSSRSPARLFQRTSPATF
jgi:hypothetical protein